MAAMTFWLSRLTLSRSPDIQALRLLLDPPAGNGKPRAAGRRMDAHHRLIWSAFAGAADAPRDFLWRDAGAGKFIVLSRREPLPTPLFEAIDTRPFAPDLAPGDRLAFLLRANATRQKRGGPRVDVVMDALHDVPRVQRAARRMELAEAAGLDWLDAQGARSGFALLRERSAVTGYRTVALPGHRGPSAGRPQFGVLDFEGVLEVTNPDRFLARLATGFGRARAFGCGLMLIRPA